MRFVGNGMVAADSDYADLEGFIQAARQVEIPSLTAAKGRFSSEPVGPIAARKQFARYDVDRNCHEQRPLAVVDGDPNAAEAAQGARRWALLRGRDRYFDRADGIEMDLRASPPH